MKQRLESCSQDTESSLHLWGSWVARYNQAGLGFPSVAAGFSEYVPRYPSDAPEQMDEEEAEAVDRAVRALPARERRALELVFVYRVEKWEVVAMQMASECIQRKGEPKMNRHRARELAERGSVGVEMWLRAIAA